MKCINLKKRFGRQYRVAYEESYYAEKQEFRAAEAQWLIVILCRHGHISPWGGDKLAACTAKAGSMAKRLKSLPFATVAQDGDDGANVVFAVEHFEEVAAIMKPRRRRRLSEAQRAAAAERLRKYQPAKGQSVRNVARQRSQEALESPIGTRPV
jgi:hypothetical protein